MIYEESGCEPASFVGSAPLGCERVTVTAAQYYPRFDGLTQYAVISEPSPFAIPDGMDFELSFKLMRTSWPGGAFAISSRSGSSYGLNIYLSGNGDDGAGSVGVFGTSLAAVGFSANVEYRISVKRVGSIWSLLVGGNVVAEKETSLAAIPLVTNSTLAALDGGTFKMQGFVYELQLTVGGVLAYALPMNQKPMAVQLPSVGASSATIINHTEAMWEQI
ncbi:hypothetical protein [Vibrio anguillarum]|uniref:hypothetical protein n=1 Tax=Vibrio anguillarum TaxID=55601 RepID=UPI0002EC8856|nr:hypothetical protein [Vibrio anguillarum]OEE50469.1 hypothetical protein A1QU_10660 [Vibrio anguillarum]